MRFSLSISYVNLHEVCMRSLMNQSQFNEWRHFEDTLDEATLEHQKINDYYTCLIECDALNQSRCKRICKTVLM
jgi:hypothetical protein